MAQFSDDPRGVLDPDFLALGLGGTNMMAMLWSVALGRRAVGVEMRGDPFLGVHWNIRADLYHQLGMIDQMMLDRYGEQGVPHRSEGQIFRLAECFYSANTVAGDIVADQIIDGYDRHQHIVGTIHHVEFIDDRWKDGVPNRVVTLLRPPAPPAEPDPTKIRSEMIDVLDGPSTFQAGAASILVLLRRYLERIERMDLDSGREQPRVRLFTRHRVVTAKDDGFIHLEDGKKQIRIEHLQELDFKGKFVRVRAPRTEIINIGVPELFVIAQGFSSSDADRLGFEQEDVKVDHRDGRGEVVAQADFLAGLIEVLVGGRLRRRISSEFDADGREYWVRQIAVGHENDPEVGWVLVQVPDFKTFDPVGAGLIEDTCDRESPEFFAAYQQLVYEYYIEQCADILELPKSELTRVQMVYGPKLFSLIERMGKDARVAKNGVVAGDSFGNGHFLTSGGAMTGMIGHSARVLEYWRARDAGVSAEDAIHTLANKIKDDTHGWLHVSAQEYSEAVPINFGQERIQEIARTSGLDVNARAHAIDATRRQRHSLLPLDPSDWRRLFLRNGKVLSAPLPELHAMHPALRAQRAVKKGAKIAVVFVAPALNRSTLRYIQALLGQPGVRMALISEALPLALPANTRARLAGFKQISDCRDANKIIEAVRSFSQAIGKPDLLLGIDEMLELALAESRGALGVTGMTSAIAKNFHDKVRMRELLAGIGVPIPRHRAVRELTEALAFAAEVGFPLVLKPLASTGAHGVVRIENETQLRACFDEHTARFSDSSKTLLAEESVRGRECSFEVMTIGGLPAWHSATRCTPSVLEAIERPGVHWRVTLPRELDDPADATIRRMGFAALRALGMGSGISHMEWFRRDDGTAVVSEIAARPPAAQLTSLLGQAHGADMYRAWANGVLHGLFAPIPRPYASGALFVRAEGDGRAIAAIHGVEELKKELGPIIVEVSLPELGARRAEGTSYEGEGFLIFRHEKTAVVDQALELASTRVKIELR